MPCLDIALARGGSQWLGRPHPFISTWKAPWHFIGLCGKVAKISRGGGGLFGHKGGRRAPLKAQRERGIWRGYKRTSPGYGARKTDRRKRPKRINTTQRASAIAVCCVRPNRGGFVALECPPAAPRGLARVARINEAALTPHHAQRRPFKLIQSQCFFGMVAGEIAKMNCALGNDKFNFIAKF